jgi:enamine deaminase RidA (YjgF/YER057c/UK114 family)
MERIMETLQPAAWPKPKGYANAVAARGKTVFLAGQVGWDEKEVIVSDDFAAQAKQALRNVVTILAEAGGRPEHVVRLTWFVTDKKAYLGSLNELGKAYREIMGRHYPAMSLLVVSALVEDGAKVEIEATAVLPE